MKRPGLLVGLVLAVGLAATGVAVSAREANTQFVAAQQGLVPVRAPQLEQLVSTTDDPRPFHRGRALGARCTSSGTGALGNPWSCEVRYPELPAIHYAVTVRANRSIEGVARLLHSTTLNAAGEQVPTSGGGELVVKGCCVAQAP
jgi:hypothetical protein